MKTRLNGKRISGLLSVVPARSVDFLDEIDNYDFSHARSMQLKEVMGFDRRRIVEEGQCTSDLCMHGMNHLLEKGLIDPADIGALVVVTQTPDHFIPPTSAIIHGKLGLGPEALCFDINHGCCGYLYGLLQAFMLLELPGMGKVVLMNGDTLSRACCQQDRNIYPMIGDAAAITVVQKSARDEDIFINMKMDGGRADWLSIPAGAFRNPSSPRTREVTRLPDGNRRSQEHFYMNGSGVFLFTQTDVPGAIEEALAFAGVPSGEIESWLFHQPNRFMLRKLASRLGINPELMPSDVVGKYGNSSSATIPLAACDALGERLMGPPLKACLSGFGVGLAWGAFVMDIGGLDFCELIEMGEADDAATPKTEVAG